MHKKIAFLFPGQGAQIVGMGKEFFDSYRVARELFQQGDDLLNLSLSQLIFSGPAERLKETKYCQPALYVTSLAILKVIQQQFPQLGLSMCAGLSLGEYTALTAAGHLEFEPTLSLVKLRAEAMHRACEQTQGGMAAIFGLSAEAVQGLVKEVSLPHDLWCANFNCPGQTVISGSRRGIEAGIVAAKAMGAKRVVILEVHGAFHSGLMHAARETLSPMLSQILLQPSSSALVMNVCGDVVREPERIREYLIEQVTAPVLWEKGIRRMQTEVDLFIEVGGKILASMNAHIGVSAPTITLNQLKDLEKLTAI